MKDQVKKLTSAIGSIDLMVIVGYNQCWLQCAMIWRLLYGYCAGKSKWMKRTYSYDKLNRPTVIEYTDNMSGSTITVKEAHYYEYDKSS